MKKIISILLAIIAMNFCIVGYAAGSPTFIVSSTDAEPGDTIDVTVSVNNNPGLTSMKLAVSFDSDLELKKVKYNSDFSGQTMQPNNLESPVTLIWLSPFENVNQNGVFATLTFKVSENAVNGDSSSIKLSYDPDDIYNLNEENISFSVVNGNVSISGGANTSECSHESKTVVDSENPTCTKEGIITYLCSSCGKKFTATVPATGHVDINNDGKCDVCGSAINPCAGAKLNVSDGSVDYRTNVTLKSTADGVPSGYYVAIYDGSNQVAVGDNSSVTYSIEEIKSNKTYTIKIVDANGNVQKDSNGNALQKDVTINVNASFIKKLVAFFKGLFGLLPSKIIQP